MKYTIEVDKSLVAFFREKIDDTIPVEVLLSKMLGFLRELLILANENNMK